MGKDTLFTQGHVAHFLVGILGFYLFRVVFKTSHINAVIITNILHIIESTNTFNLRDILANMCACPDPILEFKSIMNKNIATLLGTLVGAYMYSQKIFSVSPAEVLVTIFIFAFIHCSNCQKLKKKTN